MQDLYVIYAYALVLSFAVSVALTEVVRRLALRWKFYDLPGDRKVHVQPIPLLGGVAIVFTFFAVILGHLAALSWVIAPFWPNLERSLLVVLGEDAHVKLSGIFAGGLLIFVLGLVDDMKALRPGLKLVGQIAAAIVLVLSGMRLDLFILTDYPLLAAAVTVFWVVFMTNSLNFLDNMDGLCGGVSVIAALSFFLCVQPHEDHLVRFLLMVFAGSVSGFLFHNLSPARIFMGDAGSMFNGFMLATIAMVGTFHIQGTPRIAVAAPLLALSVPIFDTISVVIIRIRLGQNIMLGDKRHFSHRLVDLGMTQRQAVSFIFLVAAVAGLGAALLPLLDKAGTLIVLAQTCGIFLLIVLLMSAHGRDGGNPS